MGRKIKYYDKYYTEELIKETKIIHIIEKEKYCELVKV